MASKNEPIGTVECIAKGCTLMCEVYRYRERGNSEKSIANRRFAGKLYFICLGHGKFGGDPRDKRTQEYILENAEIWGPEKRQRAGRNAGGTSESTGVGSEENAGNSSVSTGESDAPGAGDSIQSRERVELAVGMNEVQVDEHALAAEADAAVSAVEPEVGNAPTFTGENATDGVGQLDEPWGPFFQTSVRPIVFNLVLPQWHIQPDEQHEVTDALGQCCDQLFPGGPAGKYACWVRLILGSVAIVAARYVMHDGKFPPLGPKRQEKPRVPAESPSSPAGPGA